MVNHCLYHGPVLTSVSLTAEFGKSELGVMTRESVGHVQHKTEEENGEPMPWSVGRDATTAILIKQVKIRTKSNLERPTKAF